MNGDGSPVPPPHGVKTTSSPPPKPAIDPEACKVLGNKYFKAQDYKKAIKEYTKGWFSHVMGPAPPSIPFLQTNAADTEALSSA